jgi:hypothetical protein
MWVKGQSGNPLGYRTKRQWIKEKERFEEAKKSWAKLLDLRDGLILERKMMMVDGKMQEVIVTPSAHDLIDCCDKILSRAVGKPKQEVSVTSAENRPLAWNIVFQSPGGQNGDGKPELVGFQFMLDGKTEEKKPAAIEVRRADDDEDDVEVQ